MSDDLSKVDWGEPIEAYHEDGRVVRAWLSSDENQPDADGDYVLCFERGGPNMKVYHADGTVWADGLRENRAWRIRNVADVPRNSEASSDDIAKRMEVLVRAVADETSFASWMDHTAEARAIVALLPEPVDADLVEARRIACNEVPSWVATMKRKCMQGDYDYNLFVVIALAAIRRGRALERDSRER